METSLGINLDDSEVKMAATKIQAGFKGSKASKEVAALKSNNEEETIDTIDVDLEDPEVEMTETKIQAGFKGF
jgi:multidrug resistance efflux pump